MLYSPDTSLFFTYYACSGPILLTETCKLNLHSGGPKHKNDDF